VTVGERIAVIGCCGAGKSYLALQLGAKLGLPVIHLDQLAWRAGWVEVPNDELARKQQAVFTRDSRWIADGARHRPRILDKLAQLDRS
jgi:adenylate kinase family enzyme